MDACLVCKGAIPARKHKQVGQLLHINASRRHLRNGVHEGYIDFDSLCDQVLDLTEHGEVVLVLDVFRVSGVQASDKAT
jgi:hypothetical protein